MKPAYNKLSNYIFSLKLFVFRCNEKNNWKFIQESINLEPYRSSNQSNHIKAIEIVYFRFLLKHGRFKIYFDTRYVSLNKFKGFTVRSKTPTLLIHVRISTIYCRVYLIMKYINKIWCILQAFNVYTLTVFLKVTLLFRCYWKTHLFKRFTLTVEDESVYDHIKLNQFTWNSFTYNYKFSYIK